MLIDHLVMAVRQRKTAAIANRRRANRYKKLIGNRIKAGNYNGLYDYYYYYDYYYDYDYYLIIIIHK